MSDGAAALARSSSAERFDLVMSDIVMAGAMDGLGRRPSARASASRPAGAAGDRLQRRASRVGGEFTVLRKPFLMAELSRTVAKLDRRSGRPTGPNVVRLRDAKRAVPGKAGAILGAPQASGLIAVSGELAAQHVLGAAAQRLERGARNAVEGRRGAGEEHEHRIERELAAHRAILPSGATEAAS